MDLRKVKKLIELLESSALLEMEITEGDNTIRLSRASHAAAAAPPYPTTSYVMTDQLTAAQVDSQGEHQVGASQASQAVISGSAVNSPMVGTFYPSASPESEHYVSVGSVVEIGDTLCIIEAMKTFNQLEADMAGTIKAIYKSSGDPVEFGEPLFLID